MIFIDTIDNRLNKIAKPLFKEGLFYFDVFEKNWEKKIINFLSKPLKEIELLWKNKFDKNQLLLEYLGSKNTETNYYKILQKNK